MARRVHLNLRFVIFASFLSSAVALNYCPPDWREENFACFYYNPEPLSHPDADAACGALVPGARLAMPRDSTENNFIITMRPSGTAIWMGLSRPAADWVTMGGALSTDVPFLAWSSGQPSPDTAGSCSYFHSSSWEWFSANCTTQHASVCMFYLHISEINPEVVMTFNRLTGAMDWSGYRNSYSMLMQDGHAYNVSLTTGPTSLADSAFKLIADKESYVAFTTQTDPGVNYMQKNFYYMFYVYLASNSIGPIIQYRHNDTNYGFNIWSYGNGSLLIDLVPSTQYGPVPDATKQFFVASGCITLNQWNFITVNYWYANNGELFVWAGTTKCLQVTATAFDVEMSVGFDVGRRERIGDDDYLDAEIACLISGEAAPVSAFFIAEAFLWCKQGLQETTMDRTVAKRSGLTFVQESNLIGMWPLDDFHHGREAVGRNFMGTVSNNTYAFGPEARVNSTLLFDGITTMVSLNGQPNQAALGPAFNMLRRSFTISAYIYMQSTATDGGPLASFAYDSGTSKYTTTILINSATNVEVIMPLLGGETAWTDKTFASCMSVGSWQFLSVVYDYTAGELSVYVDAVQCGTTQSIGQGDIEAHTNVIVGRTSSTSDDPASFFKGKMSCFSLYSMALSTADMLTAMQDCKHVLASGKIFDGSIYKPQQLSLFLPLGRAYGVQDISGRNMHGYSRGRVGSGTGPLGHPYSAAKFFNEDRSGIDIQVSTRENVFSIGTNDSVTYMGYIYLFPNRDNNLPNNWNHIFEHWDVHPSGGMGTHFYYHTAGQLFYHATSRMRSTKSNVFDVSNLGQWRWFMLRYSKLTRLLTISLDGVVVHESSMGWTFTNMFSSMTLGYRYDNSLRSTMKMACFMMYNTDLRDDETKHAKDMCHAAIIRAHGPRLDTSKCKHTVGGWDYTGTIAVTSNGRLCMDWKDQTTYTDPTAFPEKSLAGARSFCRNPEFDTSVRSGPWCYTQDPATPWEYCTIPTCGNTNLNPFHKAEDIMGYWPMGKAFGGMDISGHDAHAGVGADTTWDTGPNNIANTASRFSNAGNGHYWVQHSAYNNMAELLDLGDRKAFYPSGYSYHIFAKYTTSYTADGTMWSWESSNGDGGNQGLKFTMIGSGQVQVLSHDKDLASSYTLTCGGLTNNQWYQFTFVYNRDATQLQLYKDSELCASWNYDPHWSNGLYTYTGSFKFGRTMYQSGSSTSLACAIVYLNPLTPNDIRIIRQKCLDTLAGAYNELLLEPARPVALWPMSAHSEGFNTRGPNHARFGMVEPIPSAFSVPQGAMAFPGNNLQYFWAFQDYMGNLDVCQQSRSFAVSAYAFVETTGTMFSFQASSSTYDDTNLLGRGVEIAFQNTKTDIYYNVNDGANVMNPVQAGVLGTAGWSHVTVSYDYQSDNFYMFVNGTMVYNQVNARYVYCQTSGSVSLSRSAARPLTLSHAATPFRGAMSCAQLYSRGFQSEEAVRRSQRYCRHPDFIGCYPAHETGSNDFTFNPGFLGNINLTIVQCRERCGRYNFEFAGIRDGSMCMCGNTYGTDGPEAPQGCTSLCPVDNTDGCGGLNHYSVYRSVKSRITEQATLKSAAYANCPPGWMLRDKYCYRVFDTRLTFTDAEASCGSFGAQLATIADFDENNVIAAIAPSTILASDYICLGINSTVSGQYKGVNIDGTPFFFANWASGQPGYSDYWGCMLMSNRQWYSQNPTNPLYYACKKPVVPHSDFIQTSSCLPGWSRFNDNCYIFRSELTTYQKAKQTCSNYIPQASLPKVTSLSQYLFLVNITDMQRPFWLGLEYLPPTGVGGNFTWIKDNAVLGASDFALWAGDHSQDTLTRRCGYADSRTQYFWRTAECDGSRRLAYLCHYTLDTSGPRTIGLSSGAVVDAQLTAVGAVNESQPWMGRVSTTADGAFCSNETTVPGLALVIDLRNSYNITEIWMQGSPTDHHWTTEFTVEHSSDGGVTWSMYSYTNALHFNGSTWNTLAVASTTLIPGNGDQNTIIKHAFQAPIIANKIKVSPTQFNNQPCMRVELFGELDTPNPTPSLDIAFKPLAFEFSRLSGTNVRYNATVYTFGAKNRLLPFGDTERVTGMEYVYRPRLFGRQRINFFGIDAEGRTHELTYDTTTGTRLRGMALNMCPVAILYGAYAACEVRLIGGSDVDMTTDYGFEIQGPRRTRSTMFEMGYSSPPLGITSDSVDNQGYIYMMPNQVARTNGSVYAIEADIVTPGWVTIQIYKPSCTTTGTFFCAVCHCCLSTNASCVDQHAFDSYACASGYGKDPFADCSLNGADTLQARVGYFAGINPKIDYEFVTEWRKYFAKTGSQIVYLEDYEVMEMTMGMVMAYYRSANDDGRIKVYSASTIKEYSFLDAANGFDTRMTLPFISYKTFSTMSTSMHMIKLIGSSSVGISFGRKWQPPTDGKQTVLMTASDRLYPENILTLSYEIEVQYKCVDFEIVFPAIADAATFVGFTVPEHNGSKCFYSIDFGDRTSPTTFDYTQRNQTFTHVYKLDGSYNVTLYVWNLVYSSSTWAPITVVFPIQRMSTYIANAPATELDQYSTAVISFAQVSNGYTITDLDYGGTLGVSLNRNFGPCPAGWVSGTQIGSDYCYRYFWQYNLNFHDAEFFCASVAGTLFTAHSSAELDFIKNVMTSAGGPTDKGAWSGYTQIRDDFQYWVSLEDKRSLPPPFWQETSAKYPIVGGGPCGYYDYAGRRLQNDNCTELRPFVCKRETAIATFCGPNTGWTYHSDSNRCFKVYTALSTYLTAVTTCRQIGGRLAVPDTSASHDFIVELIQEANPTISYYLALWRPSGTSFMVFDGEKEFTPPFTAYDSGQPTTAQGENCLVLQSTNGKWRSVGCSDMDGFVCEKPISGTKPTRYFSRTASRRYISPSEPTLGCPVGWTRDPAVNRCYKLLTDTPLTWQNAENDCFNRYGAHLASVHTAAEQSFFVANVIGSIGADIWIGYGEATASNWVWSDGSDTGATTTAWASGEPSLGGVGYAYYASNMAFWYENDGTATKSYACSKPAARIPKKWAGDCPTGYHEFEGRCFKYYSSANIFSNALTTCRTDGGSLATIRSDADLAFLRGMLPITINSAWIGLEYFSSVWRWAPDVRGNTLAMNYTGMWAATYPGGNTGCGRLSRSNQMSAITTSCTSTNYPFICEQPATVCPPGWNIWAGSCYRAFVTQLHIQPGTDYDIAGVACQFEDALSLSPVNTDELNYGISLAGSGNKFALGYRRLATSMDFIDLSGRPSYFAGQAGEPLSGNYYSYYPGTGSTIVYSSDIWTDATVCQMPSQLNADLCSRQCIATSDFRCITYMYDGRACYFTSENPADEWHGLRESNGLIDIYSLRQDICPEDLLANATEIVSDLSTASASEVQLLTAGNNGFVPVNETLDMLSIDFGNTVWLTGLVIAARADANEYVKTFKISYTFDRSAWYTYEYPIGTEYVFNANTADEPVVVMNLPEQFLLKAMKIVPVTYETNPSFRLRVLGCHGAVFYDYADYKYLSANMYQLKIDAYGPRNNATTEPMTLGVMSRLTSFTIPEIPALPYGDWVDVPFNYMESKAMALPTVNGTFDGQEFVNLTTDWTMRTGLARIGPWQYPDIGWFPLNMTIDNWLSDPMHDDAIVWVDFAVVNLTVSTNATATHGALPNQTIAVYISMANCSRCNVSVSYGAVDATPQTSFFNTYAFIDGYVNIVDIPVVTYPTVGGYFITVQANNFLPIVKTVVYDIYVQNPPDADSFNYTASSPNMIPYGSSAAVTFNYLYTGAVTDWPSNASYSIDYLDGYTWTAAFDPTMLPPVHLQPSVTMYAMATLTHHYTKFGTLAVPVTVFNRIKSISSTVYFDVEEELVGLRLVPDRNFIAVGDTVTFNITRLFGSRFTFQATVPYPDGSELVTPVYEWNVTSIDWTFDVGGTYYPYINGSNSVSSVANTPLLSCCPIVVQYIVQPNSYRLTTSPSQGKLIFDGPQDDTGHANTIINVWYNSALIPPTSPYYVISFGDDQQSVNTSLVCQPDLATTTDGPWVLCVEVPYTYKNVTMFTIQATMQNLASSETFTASYTVYVSVTNLRLGIRYSENVTHPSNWQFGFPRIDPVLGPKPYSLAFFPSGRPLQITANAKLGDGLQYCFSTSIEGPITDCSGPWSNSPNFVVRTFDYDTPCMSRLENCGLTIFVVASNPVDTATASITVYLQKPTHNLKLLEYGPAAENTSFPLWATFDQLATDACWEIDYGTPKLSSNPQIQLFGSEYMCADTYSQEVMKSLKPISAKEIEQKVVSVAAEYYKHGQYVVSMKARNFVESLDQSNTGDALIKNIIVTRGPCSRPLLYIPTSVVQSYKKDDLVVPGQILMNCTASTLMSLNWTMLYRPDIASAWTDVTTQYLSNSLRKLMMRGNKEMPVLRDVALEFAGTTLPYGFYRFTMDASMVEEVGLNSTLYHDIEIIKSDLIAKIWPPGSRRELVFKDVIEMNGYDLSYDPDIGGVESSKDGLQAYYFCKRDCDGSWPTFSTESQVNSFIANPSGYAENGFKWSKCLTDDYNLRTEGFEVNGCFIGSYHQRRISDPSLTWGFPSVNPTSFRRTVPRVLCGENATTDCNITLSNVNETTRTLSIQSIYQFENQTYNLMVIVKKDNRWALARQSYRLERGAAPQALVTVVTNCIHPHNEVFKLNPTSRASFHGLITDRIPGRMYFFDWQLIYVQDTHSVVTLLDNIVEAADNFSWPYENWLNSTSTGSESDDLSLNAHLFGPDSYARYFIAYVTVVRSGNPRRGISSLPFYVNTPPDVSNVSCKANEPGGIAMYTVFKFECNGFYSIHGPLTKFVYSMKTCSYCPLVVLTPTIGTPSLQSGLQLPPGIPEENYMVTIYVAATDPFDSVGQVEFQVQVQPQVDLAEITRLYNTYKTSVGEMGTENLCQIMYTYAGLLNSVVLEPIYTTNQTAYDLMTDAQKKMEDDRVTADTDRYEIELNFLREIRFNITNWLMKAVQDNKRGLKQDENAIRTCCSAVANVISEPDQASEARTLKKVVSILERFVTMLDRLSKKPERDADRIDDAASVCLGAAGMASDAMEDGLIKIKAEKKKKNTDNDNDDDDEVGDNKENGSDEKSTKSKKGGDDNYNWDRRRKRAANGNNKDSEESKFGTIANSIATSEEFDKTLASLQVIVLGGKVLKEARSVINGPGMTCNLQRMFVGEMSNITLPSGSPDDCGRITLGDATVIFASADPLGGLNDTASDAMPPAERLKFVEIMAKSCMQSGNNMAYDETADDLNSQVQGLVFLNSSGVEVSVKDLPFELEIIVESKNKQSPEETSLKSLTAPGDRSVKSMILSVSPLSALFISVERWDIPNLCENVEVDPNDMGLNLTCTGNTTYLTYDRTNHSVPGLNITDEEVVFFVYAKFNDTPSETNYDLTCTLPLGAFEEEVDYVVGLGGEPSLTTWQPTNAAATTAPPTTAPPTTTAVPTVLIECSSLAVWNVTCCNGSIVNGMCLGDYLLPTTPAPTVIKNSQRVKKNCQLPKEPNRNACFFDHRIVNVTNKAKLLKIGVRAIARSQVRQFLFDLAANNSNDKNISTYLTYEYAKGQARASLMRTAVRVGYKYATFTSSCKFFDPATKGWSSAGCRVGSLSNPGGNPSMTQCFCNHLTSFSSSFDVPMNTFDPNDSAFNKLDENPICFAFGICGFCIFFVFLIWARKKDKEDEKKWGTTPLADNDPRDKYAYEMTVWTGNRSDSGTTARVSFILLGDEGETPVHMLEDDERDVLQRGSIDSFLLLTPRSLGKLVQLRIWHDNSGRSPNWYMARMLVCDLQRNRQYYFLVDRWLAIDEDDGMVERIVPVAGKKELAGFEHLFFTKSRRKLTDGHIWVSVLARPPLSKFTRCQRLTCCLSVLYCTMLANIMFYGQDSEPPGSVKLDLGPISMSLTKIFMSIVSALVVVPVNLIIVQLFRMSKHRPTKQEKKIEDLRNKAIKAENEERKRLLAAGAAAPPDQIAVTSVSENVSAPNKPGETRQQRKARRKAEKAKKKKPFKLPWWCIIVAYILATCTCGVCFWAIVEYGGALGPEKAEQWLVSMMISLVTDILFLQPVKILAIALFYALIIRSPTKDEDMEEKAALMDDEVFAHSRPTEAEMVERKKKNDESKQDYVFLPPDPDELKQARELRMKEQQMWKIIKEIAFTVFFLYLLLMVAFSTQDDWSMQLQKQMRRVYLQGSLATRQYNPAIPSSVKAYRPKLDQHDERFLNMVEESHFFEYLERTLIPSVLDGTWYNGAFDSTTDVFTKDQILYLVGSLRIRQVRIRPDKCRTAKQMRDVYTENCLAPYSILKEETRNFTLGWQEAPLSNTTTDEDGDYITEGDPRGFSYTSEIDDRGLPLTGSLATYNGGGYIIELGKNKTRALQKVAFLRKHKWIDSQTRAVFVEFNLYCPNRNLFAISQTIVEFFEGGSIVHFPYFYITKVDPYFGTFALIILVFEFITLAIVLALFVREIKLAIKYKRAYWADSWAVLEFVHLLSCIIMAIMFVMRYAMARLVIGDNYKNSKKDGYTNFTIFITYDELVQTFMGFVLFLGFLKLIRLLRFNRRLVIMIATLKHVKSMMISFFVVFFVVYVGFAQMGYLAFGAKAQGYSSFISSLETLFSMLLNKFNYNEMENASGVVGPFFFLFFALFVNIFLVNAFIALLIVSYEEVRADATKQGNEHEMLAFIMNKFKQFLGLTSKRPANLSIDKRFAYLDSAMHEDEVDKFTSRMDDLMTKLDSHLEKTKTQFASMFDQNYLQRKQREIYVTD